MDENSAEWEEIEAFWAPIVTASEEDLRQLLLWPPYINHDLGAIQLGVGRPVAIVFREAMMTRPRDPSRVLVEVARAVAPKGEV